MKKVAIVALLSSFALAGCTPEQHRRAVTGALVGGATGAAIGAVATGTLPGAAIGAGIGAGVGAAIGVLTAPGGYAY